MTSKILDTLQATVEDRRKVYGSPKPNMQDIADLWNVKLRSMFTSGSEVPQFTAADVAQMMRLVKEARLLKTPGHQDSLLDIAGYVLVEEACHQE